MTQRDVVLKMLREAGAEGVSAHDLVYAKGITRGAAVIFALRGEGHAIATTDEGTLPDGRKRLARYILQERVLAPPRPPTDPRPEPQPYRSLGFNCGCVRAEDGMSWALRCTIHDSRSRTVQRSAEVPW